MNQRTHENFVLDDRGQRAGAAVIDSQAGAERPEDHESFVVLARAAFQYARAGDAEALRELLDRGVPPDARNEKGDSLLMLASYNGSTEATRLLLERGADPDQRNDRGQTALGGSSFKGNVALVRLLLDQGAGIDPTGPHEKTPLMFAAMFDRVEVVALLLARGADPGRRDGNGNTAWHLARTMGAERSARSLARAAALASA